MEKKLRGWKNPGREGLKWFFGVFSPQAPYFYACDYNAKKIVHRISKEANEIDHNLPKITSNLLVCSQVASTRRQRSDLFDLRIKLLLVTTSLTT